MDAQKGLARFESERQALAVMDHPNIAKVLDAGTTASGRPYFVMELVQGIPLTQYCDLHELSIEARLGVFAQVCFAIDHAHQKGTIHGDLKPSNILIAHPEAGLPPVPKVINFGIPEPANDPSQTGNSARFPSVYTSPEQTVLSGSNIDSRSDIYSLGVLLYDLLTGQAPFQTQKLAEAGPDELRRIIREENPPQPSTRLRGLDAAVRTEAARQRRTEPLNLLQRIRGDLDSIVMKCLAKEPTGRYETADGLARDIQRYLSNEPVSAHPPKRAHKFQKTMGLLHKVGLMWIA
jgi:serine/threonine protein kinase